MIRPPMLLEISGVIKDPRELERVYEIGRKTGEKYVESVKEYLELSRLTVEIYVMHLLMGVD